MINIGWIDFSIDDRKKARQLLALIKPEGQLDELGIGYIRDAISNRLFPGISTIQTRAKYFFIVPSILRNYMSLSPNEKKKNLPQNYLANEEDKIQDILKEKYLGTSEKGIIGFTMARGKYVRRKPSEIYWNGLNTFGFIDTGGLSMSSLFTNAYRQNRYLSERYVKDEDLDDSEVAMEETFKIRIPYIENWQKDLQIQLTKDEALYFSDCLKNDKNIYLRDSLLFELFSNEDLMSLFIVSDNFHNFARGAQDIEINPIVKSGLAIGQNFYVLMEASHLFYNHLLQKHFFDDYDGIFLIEFDKWIDRFEINMINFDEFDLSSLYSISNFRNYKQTEGFLKSWWQYIYEYKKSYDSELLNKMEKLIKSREQSVKQGKARLQKSPLNNIDVKKGRRIGILDMSYRFYNAKMIVEDILKSKTN